MRQCNCPRCMAKRQREMQKPFFEEDKYFEDEKWYPEDKEDKWYPEEKEELWFPEQKPEREEKRPERRPEKPECEEKRPERRPEKPECEEKRPEKRPDCKCKVVYEPTVYCTEEKEFHHCVKHIVPVVCKQIENHHYDHDYVIEKKYVKEEHRFDHGQRKEDWCKVAGCKNGRKDCDCERF